MLSRPRLSLARALIALWAIACGEVVFVDPDAALKAELRFRDAVRLVVEDDPRTYIFARVATQTKTDAQNLQLSVEGPSGVFQVPQESITVERCAPQTTCYFVVLGPGLPELGAITLNVWSLGHVSSTALSLVELGRHQLSASATEKNSMIAVSVGDPIRASLPGFPRRFEAHVRPGACGAPQSEGPWTRLLDSPEKINARFSEEASPLACVSVRPTLPADGPIVGQISVPARAETTRFNHTYLPPSETAPLVYQVLFDLELPSVERCAEAQDLVRTALRQGAEDVVGMRGGGLEILELEANQIAVIDQELCRQRNDRSFSTLELLERTRTAVEAFDADRFVRVVFVYVSNLDLLPPPRLEASFLRLREDAQFERFQIFLMAIAPERATSGLGMDLQLPWVAADVPTFRTSIRGSLGGVWPFQTMLHSPATVVPLAEASQRERFVAYRVCNNITQVTPLGSAISSAGALAPPEGGPAYRVGLEPQVLMPASQFSLPRVVVTWEGCERLCDQPREGGDVRMPWLDIIDC